MTNASSWTPATSAGLVPLRPLTFGGLLGGSFQALRHNPGPLLGFGVGVQALTGIVGVAVVGVAAAATFSRLDSVDSASDEFTTLLVGSSLIVGLAALAAGLVAGLVAVFVQGIVVRDVAHAVLGSKPSFAELWRELRPAIWRLLGYTVLVLLVGFAIVVAAVAAIAGLSLVAVPLGIIATVLVVLAAVPLSLWLTTKLAPVSAIIVLEGAPVGAAIVRAWRLTRGRFWPYFGTLILISIIFGTIAQIVSVPGTLLSSALTSVLAPTDGSDASAVVVAVAVSLGVNAIVLLVQAVSIIVTATASSLIYVDARMRHEGLDIDLLRYLDARATGRTDLADPWTLGVGRGTGAGDAASAAGHMGTGGVDAQSPWA